MLYKEITRCRSCGSNKLDTVLDLGDLYISDFILSGGHEEKAPLELVYCARCSLVQLGHTVSREHLYKEQYWYRSGVNESMVKALQDVVLDAMRHVELQPGDRVLDIGANDGTMLCFYPRMVYCDGYEPAQQFVKEATERARARIFPTFFPPHQWSPPYKYKIITSIAQFYNAEEPDRYVKCIKDILHPEGVWIVQFQDLEGMLAADAVDNICHEHLTYWSDTAFQTLTLKKGLRVKEISRNSVNGGSIRYVVEHETGPINFTYGRDQYEALPLHNFKLHAEKHKTETLDLLRKLRAEDKSVLGVAASTKANTLLQYYGVGPELLPAIAERSPEKVGRVTVGTHIPIISEDELRARKPDYLLCLAWHFFEPFRLRYSDINAKWITPLPELRVEECPSIQEERSDKDSDRVTSMIR